MLSPSFAQERAKDGAPKHGGKGECRSFAPPKARAIGVLSKLELHPAVKPGRRQKTAPVFGGGQVALVLSCCESFFGGHTAGEPLARVKSLRGWLRPLEPLPHL
jgi:hypothetical protein